MKTMLIKVVAILCLFGLWSCNDDSSALNTETKEWTEKTVAVVLPMGNGLDSNWNRCIGLFLSNLERAFKGHTEGVRLNFEYYDETGSDIAQLAETLALREDVYAVIGGLYSSHAAILASNLTVSGKTFFTLSTSEELVRAYSSTGYLWALTETDITQCEVLLSKVVNYSGKSVALIAKNNDVYGKTFTDWFAFQAKELGLENKGVFAYDDSSVGQMARQAMSSGAEYVICAPSEIEEIAPILQVYAQQPRSGGATPRLLFSDTGYGKDVLELYGDQAEGMEGVAFGADPESGFDVTYKTYYGEAPTRGEAQLYDAAMLIAYAAWHQHHNQNESLLRSLRAVVSGKGINMRSWNGEGMGLVIDAIASGGSPNVNGASGELRFDTKIFTNVLVTTYYNYQVYGGKYIILDYNTTDGGNRTDATLAGWNWKVSQMQEFDNSGSISYPEHKGNWALLVATSKGWSNYRHQADVLAIYQQLKKSGYPDDHIVLIMEDDLATAPTNPEPGVVRISRDGENVRSGAVIDYKLSELTAQDFLSILSGEKSDRIHDVIEAGCNDNVFVYWCGHGVPGGMCWNDDDYGMTGDVLAASLSRMYAEGRYRKLLMMVEACFSGGVMESCEGIPRVLAITAADGEETSKADVFNADLNVWMSNRFTSTFIGQITENPAVSMRDLYYRLFINTVGSHVMVYNALNYGNLYKADMAEFIRYKHN